MQNTRRAEITSPPDEVTHGSASPSLVSVNPSAPYNHPATRATSYDGGGGDRACFWAPAVHQLPAVPFPGPVLPFPGTVLSFPGPAVPFPGTVLPFPGPALPFPGPAVPFPGPVVPTVRARCSCQAVSMSV